MVNYDLDENESIDSKLHFKHVEGKPLADLKLFALSTCGWCKKTRMYLEVEEIEYDYIYVDLATGEEREEVMKDLEKFNPDMSFPTLVINNGEYVIIGYEPEKIAETLGIEYEEL